MSPRQDVLSSLGTATLLAALVLLPLALFTWWGGVGFLAPGGAWLGLLVVPLLLLYVLKSRRPRRVVASLLFWQAVAREQRAASPFKRLRRSLVLLLQLLALAAIVYGLARPVVQAAARGAADRVIVLDASASMLARDVDGATRLVAAQEAAIDLVRSLGPGGRATVIVCDRTAWIAVPWTEDEEALVAGIRRVEARHTPTALDEAILLAASAAGGRGAEVHLLGDGGGPPPPPVSLDGPLRFHRFGSAAENLAVVSVEARPRAASGALAGRDEDLAHEVFASVVNAGPTEREVFAGLERDGRLLAARRLTVPPGGDRPVVLEARLPPGPAAVRLLPVDGRGSLDVLPEDDAAYVIIPEERGVSVGLVAAQESPALVRALEAAGARLQLLAPGAPLTDPELRLLVFEGAAPPQLPPRDCLLLAPQDPAGPVTPGRVVERPRVAGWDREAPVLDFVSFEDVAIREARTLELGPGARALLQGEDPATGEPVVLMAAWSDGRAERVAIGFDLYASTWPLRVSFPVFVRNCLLRAARGDVLAQGGLRAGQPLAVPVGPGVVSAEVTTPDGRTVVAPARAGEAVFADTWRTGVYTVKSGDRVRRFCVNLSDPQEARIGPRPPPLEGVAVVPADEDATRPMEVGALFALVAVLILVVEVWAYHRRW